MADNDLIRAWDPFSGHVTPGAAEDTSEPEKPAEKPAPPQEPAKKPAPRQAVAKKPAVRRGRRPRKVPTDAEVQAAAKRVKP